MIILESDRLLLQEAKLSDALFIFELLNSPEWLKYIGDREIHDIKDAERYIQKPLLDQYEENGFGLYVMAHRSTNVPIGLCGLLKRDWLDHVDIGYAILPTYYKRGYTAEAAKAILKYVKEKLDLNTICAITNVDNKGSIKLLEIVGLKVENKINYDGGDEEVLYST